MASTGCLINNEGDKYPANMGKAWSDDETLQLLQSVKKKKAHQEIATEHERTLGGITSRLRHLAGEYHKEGRSIEAIMKFTGLTEGIIKEAIKSREVREIMNEKRKERRDAANKQETSKPSDEQQGEKKEHTVQTTMKLTPVANSRLKLTGITEMSRDIIEMSRELIELRNEVFDLKKNVKEMLALIKILVK